MIDQSEMFDALWDIYPRHENRKWAKKSFKKIHPSYALFEDMCKAIERQKETKQWKSGFIPHLVTWLSGERWKDEPIKVSQKRRLPVIRGKYCETCHMPAVYMSAGSAYDHYYCSQHMPEKVKEIYE